MMTRLSGRSALITAGNRHAPLFGRVVLEFVIVVAGILAALGVDDWRQTREELKIRDEHLADIAAELRTNIRTIDVIQSRALPGKFADLEAVLRFLNNPEVPVADPAELLRAFARSADAARPWMQDTQFRAFQNSGELRLIRNRQLADSLADVYEAPDTLFPQVERIQGSYPTVVHEMLPAQLQVDLNPLNFYVRRETRAPVIEDDADLSLAIANIRARREELLRLARAEAAVAAGQWYALRRLRFEFESALEQLGPWDKGATPGE